MGLVARARAAVSVEKPRNYDAEEKRERCPEKRLEYPIAEGVLERLGTRHAADQKDDEAATSRADVPAAGADRDHRGHRAHGDDRDRKLSYAVPVEQGGEQDPCDRCADAPDRAAGQQIRVRTHDEDRGRASPCRVREVQEVRDRDPDCGGGREEDGVRAHRRWIGHLRRCLLRASLRAGHGFRLRPEEVDERRPRGGAEEHCSELEAIGGRVVHAQRERRRCQRGQQCRGAMLGSRGQYAPPGDKEHRGDGQDRNLADHAPGRVGGREEDADHDQLRASATRRRKAEHRNRQRAEREDDPKADIGRSRNRQRRDGDHEPASRVGPIPRDPSHRCERQRRTAGRT
jgi:hypothetical protein